MSEKEDEWEKRGMGKRMLNYVRFKKGKEMGYEGKG